MTSYAILGLGGIGASCAVLLQQAGHDVHCLMSEKSYSYAKQHGFELETPDGTVSVKLPVYAAIEQMPVCDFFLIAIKTTHNSILSDILPKLDHKTVVVIMQNGIGIEQEVNRFVEEGRIIGASCLFRGIKDAPGKFKYLPMKNFNLIKFAQFYADDTRGGANAIVRQLAGDFQKAGFDTLVEESLSTMRWAKLINNIPVNGLTVVLDCCVQDLVESQDAWQLFCSILHEVMETAKKCHANIGLQAGDENKKIVSHTTTIQQKIYPSSKIDFDNHRPMEIKALFKNAIDIAEQYNVDMPLTTMLYQQLAFLELNN